MQFNIKIDRDWDERNFWNFIEANNPDTSELYPEIKTLPQLKAHLDKEYQSGRVQTEAKWLSEQTDTLNQIAQVLSEVIKENWNGIEEINVYASACPVCPRFISENAFFLSYFGDENWALQTCAHEMAHFLYFKKLKRLLGQEDYDTEWPGYGWLLSEILVVPIVNDPKIQKIVNREEQGYYFFSGVPEEVAQKVQAMWNPDDLLGIHEKAYELLKDYVQ